MGCCCFYQPLLTEVAMLFPETPSFDPVLNPPATAGGALSHVKPVRHAVGSGKVICHSSVGSDVSNTLSKHLPFLSLKEQQAILPSSKRAH
jgi:hypothetical protein